MFSIFLLYKAVANAVKYAQNIMIHKDGTKISAIYCNELNSEQVLQFRLTYSQKKCFQHIAWGCREEGCIIELFYDPSSEGDEVLH